jgi:hypothetical protein
MATNPNDADYVNQWRLWVYRYEQQRLAGRTHVQDRLVTAVLRQLKADLLDPSHRGSEAVAAGQVMQQAAREFVQGTTSPT